MQVTRDWLEQVSDERGLTKGQRMLLDIHCGLPYVDKLLDDFVAHFIEGCKGYRGEGLERIRSLKYGGKS